MTATTTTISLDQLGASGELPADVGGVRWHTAPGCTVIECAHHAVAGARAGWAVPEPSEVTGETIPVDELRLEDCAACQASDLARLAGRVAHWARLAAHATRQRDQAIREAVAAGWTYRGVGELAGMSHGGIARVIERS